MAYKRIITGVVLMGALAAAPVFAREDGQRRRDGSDGRRARAAEQAPRSDSRQGGERAVPRAEARQQEQRAPEVRRQDDTPRQDDRQRQQAVPRQDQRQYDNRAYQGQRQYDNRAYQGQRQYDNRGYQAQRQYDNRAYAGRQYNNRGYSGRQYDNRSYSYGRAVPRPYYSNRGGYYGSRTIIVPRIIRPSIVTVVPYRPYSYRPRFGIGIYYGDGGSYPYGYTPRGYYDPLPGRYYGGLRITDAPRDAQVFADGYYVGIVDDFDGIFQHVNLEAGSHHIEIAGDGFEPVAFDVMIEPGRTITFRAEMYPY